MNHPCMKYHLPLMKYPQLLTSGVIFAIKLRKIRTKTEHSVVQNLQKLVLMKKKCI